MNLPDSNRLFTTESGKSMRQIHWPKPELIGSKPNNLFRILGGKKKKINKNKKHSSDLLLLVFVLLRAPRDLGLVSFHQRNGTESSTSSSSSAGGGGAAAAKKWWRRWWSWHSQLSAGSSTSSRWKPPPLRLAFLYIGNDTRMETGINFTRRQQNNVSGA